MNERITDG